MSLTPLPQPTGPVYDSTGKITTPWQNYFQALQGIGIDAAPVDAQYYTATSNPNLTNERNLGALTTGFLFLTVAVGVATPSSVATIPLARGGTNADLSATGGTSQVLKQASAGAAVTVGQLASTDISDVASGTYTPTLTNVTNLDGSTAFTCQYVRVGSVVTVSGKVSVNPTAAAATELGISLPVASNFAAAENCGGAANAIAVASESAGIVADLTNDRASMQWVTVSTADHVMAFSFTYRII